MESGDLRVFMAVAEEGSITKAAERLNYVQSNVTNRIKQLETQLQTTLFYRTNRGMLLTAAGKTLFDYAERILFLLGEAEKSIRFTEQPIGPLRLGAIETTAATHLPKLLATYHQNYPDVKLSLRTGFTSDLVEKVLRYELDGAFVTGPIDQPELHQLVAFEEELVVISEPGIAALKDILHKPMLVFSEGCAHREKMRRLLSEEGISKMDLMEFGTLEAILGGVSAGLGISLLAKSTIRTQEKAGVIQIHSIPEDFRHSTILFIYRRDLFLTSAFLRFIELLQERP